MTRREWYAKLRENHLCTRCEKDDAYTLAGRSLCAECTAKKVAYNRDWRRNHPENVARWREAEQEKRRERKAEGFCVQCGAPVPDGKAKCPTCRAAAARQMQRTRIRKGVGKREQWITSGLCANCGAETMPGKRVCASCYERILKASRMGVEARTHA